MGEDLPMKRLAVLTALALAVPLAIANLAADAATTSSRTYFFGRAPLNHDWAKYANSTRAASLVWVKSGRLHVATAGARGSGLCLCRGPRSTVAPFARWDVRARATRNADHGFAIMLWPDSGSWPSAGEIDLAEFPGTERNLLQTTVHYTASNRQITKFTKGDFTRWHTYSVIWRRASLTYLLDGRTVMRVTRAAAIPTGPMHLAIQAGPDVAHPSATRARLDVDWVHVRH
jgi:hypothetical protein